MSKNNINQFLLSSSDMKNFVRMMRKIHSDNSMSVEPERLQSFSKISFHESMKFFLITAQFFGVMPLHNISKDVNKIYFKWRSVRVFYALVNSAGSFLGIVFWTVKFARDGLSVDKTGKIENVLQKSS